MPRVRIETKSEGYKITPQRVLDSIKENEQWWEKLEEIRQSEHGPAVDAFLGRAIDVYYDLNALAQKRSNLPHRAEEAARIKAIWVKSAHGTYLQETKDDRFLGKDWARWNDKQRVDYTLNVARLVTELNAGQSLTGNWENDRRVMEEYGPWIIYAGRWDENRDLKIASSNPQHYFPANRPYPTERFFIIDGQIDNAADVIRNFRMPPTYCPHAGDEIAMVSHSAQDTRILFMMAQLENHFPKEAILRMFPMLNPPGAYPEYPLQELRGLTFYRFISQPQKAAEMPYPYC